MIRLDLLLQFAAALHTLPPTQKRSLHKWLRLHLARTNGHPPRTFYIVNPTGGLELL